MLSLILGGYVELFVTRYVAHPILLLYGALTSRDMWLRKATSPWVEVCLLFVFTAEDLWQNAGYFILDRESLRPRVSHTTNRYVILDAKLCLVLRAKCFFLDNYRRCLSLQSSSCHRPLLILLQLLWDLVWMLETLNFFRFAFTRIVLLLIIITLVRINRDKIAQLLEACDLL